MSTSNGAPDHAPVEDLKWTYGDAEDAHGQGWFFNEPRGRITRSVIDNDKWSPKFNTSEQAQDFVETNALKGDPLCRKVITILTLRRLTR